MSTDEAVSYLTTISDVKTAYIDLLNSNRLENPKAVEKILKERNLI